MVRKNDAHTSQTRISKQKTVFVEGNLDSKVIGDFLKHKNIKNIRIAEINIEVDDSQLPVEQRKTAKNKVIEIIEKCNVQGGNGKFLGVIDIDYDYFNGSVFQVDNLIYTDFNSMESYFLDVELINALLNDYSDKSIDDYLFNRWIENSKIFSFLFFYQITNIESLDDSEKIEFDKLSLSNPTFIDFDKARIKIKNIISYKTNSDANAYLSKFLTFIKSLPRRVIYDNIYLFLHGKYTFRFIVALLKNMISDVRNLSYETFECVLKDKLILFKANDFRLFRQIEVFALN